MRVLALLALGSLALAGCIQSPAAQVDQAAVLPIQDLLAYDAMGASIPLPDAVGGSLEFVERLLGHRGGEPNVGVDDKGTIFVTAGPNTMRSTDHGATFEVVFNLTTAFPEAVRATPAGQLTRSSDPMLWVDPAGKRVFTNHMTGLYCSNMIVSDDEGKSWTMKPMTCGLPVNDHQKVATSIGYGPKTPKPPNPIYPNPVYYCYNKLVSTQCAVSLDGGLNFAYDRTVALTARDGCGGINGHPAPGPDGTMYVAMQRGCATPAVGVSEDNGLTWTLRKGPEPGARDEIDPDITVTKGNVAYLLYRGEDNQQYLARSKDKFATWEGPWRVSPPDVKSTVFTVITSGDDDRIAMGYLGTRDSSKEPSEAANGTRWHLFVTYSLDATAESPTFVTTQVTPDADPVQIGCVWLRGGGNPCRNLLDFIDMASDPEGRVFVALTDGCTAGCADTPAATNNESRSRDAAVAVLANGPSLYAAMPRITEGSSAG